MDKWSLFILENRSSPERTAKAVKGRSDFHLARRDLLSLEGDLRGARVTCHSGLIWLTQGGDLRDHVLEQGREVLISRKGKILIQSLDDALFSISRSRA